MEYVPSLEDSTVIFLHLTIDDPAGQMTPGKIESVIYMRELRVKEEAYIS